MSLQLQDASHSKTVLQEQIQHQILHQDERCATLSESAPDAERAMLAVAEAAEAAYAKLGEGLSLAQRVCTGLQHDLANLAIGWVPTEIWQAIFVCVVESYPITVPFSKVVYNRHRAASPFRLAAVCRRWREIALLTSELWTYVALPIRGRPGPAAVADLLGYLLERSNQRPIDILFPFANNKTPAWAWETVMARLAEEFPRWRRAKINLPDGGSLRDLNYSFLHRDAPFLEEVYIAWARMHDAYAGGAPTALTASHALRALHAPASLISPQIALPALSSLGIILDVAASLALQVIGRMPTLLDLTINASGTTRSIPPSDAIRVDPVCLPRLHSLVLSGYTVSESVHSLLSSLQAPNVRTLVLEADHQDKPSNTLLHLLRVKFPAIETLILDARRINDVNSWRIDVVLHVLTLAFPHSRHLTLSNCYFGGMGLHSSAVWPALDSITLRGRTSYSTEDYSSMPTLIGLAVWSTETEADRAGAGPPHIANVHVFVRDLSPVPAWLPRYLARIVGPENTHVFKKDGEEIPVGTDDDASFTDSDESATSESWSSSGSDWSSDSEGQILTVNGPDWASDESGDSDWCAEESTDSEWY